jgi:hypothetical protein
MADGTCSIPDCECPVFARDWCNPHYARWRRNGDPLAGRYAHRCRTARACAVAGCRRRHYGNGFCELHYLRWVKSDGDLAIVTLEGTRPSVLNPKWSADDAGYEAVHGRLNRSRGYAREHSCARCAEPATDWAYDHSSSNEKTVERRGRLYAYSTDPAHYLPLCRSCHTRLDKGLDG